MKKILSILLLATGLSFADGPVQLIDTETGNQMTPLIIGVPTTAQFLNKTSGLNWSNGTMVVSNAEFTGSVILPSPLYFSDIYAADIIASNKVVIKGTSISNITQTITGLSNDVPSCFAVAATNSALQAQITSNSNRADNMAWFKPTVTALPTTSVIFTIDGINIPFWHTFGTNINAAAYFTIPNITNGQNISYRYKIATSDTEKTNNINFELRGCLELGTEATIYKTNLISSGTLLQTGTGSVYKVYSITGSVTATASAPYYGHIQLVRRNTTAATTQYIGCVEIKIY